MIDYCKATLRKVISYWKLAFECLLIVVFVFYGIRYWSEIRDIVQRISPSALCLCVGIYSLSHFLAAMATKALFAAKGYPMFFATFLRIHLQRLPAKYLPGGIWHTVGRGADLVQLGITTRTVTQVLLLEQILAIWWAGFIGFILIGCTFDGATRMAAFALAAALLAGAGLLMWLLVRFKPNAADLAHVAFMPKVCIAYVIGWCCLAIAFTCYAWVGELTQAPPLRIAASYLVSWMVGALAFFAPQGMGVFELAMQYAVFPSQPSSAGSLWLIGSYRLVVLSADLIAWLVCGLSRNIKSPTGNKS